MIDACTDSVRRAWDVSDVGPSEVRMGEDNALWRLGGYEIIGPWCVGSGVPCVGGARLCCWGNVVEGCSATGVLEVAGVTGVPSATGAASEGGSKLAVLWRQPMG